MCRLLLILIALSSVAASACAQDSGQVLADAYCADAVPGATDGEYGPGYEPGYQGTGWDFPWPVLRTSLTHGRATGMGQPLRGTSWLNRPLEFSLETGALVMTGDPGGSTKKTNDVVAAAQVGWDFDHYWGSQLRLAWSTPDFDTTVAPVGPHSNDLVIYDASLLYYPWGDSRVRPYYRLGMGLTDIDFVDSAGRADSESLFTVPMGIGMKYQIKRTLAFRMEAVDNIAFGQGGADTMNNFTFTLGAEWRFGGKQAPEWRRAGPHPNEF